MDLKKLKEGLIAEKHQNILNWATSTSTYLFHIDVQKRSKGSKSEYIKVKYVNFVLFGSLKNS